MVYHSILNISVLYMYIVKLKNSTTSPNSRSHYCIVALVLPLARPHPPIPQASTSPIGAISWQAGTDPTWAPPIRRPLSSAPPLPLSLLGANDQEEEEGPAGPPLVAMTSQCAPPLPPRIP
jgi:hypothetical protein